MKKIGFVTNDRISNKRLWSGTISSLNLAISKYNTVVPLELDTRIGKLLNKIKSRKRNNKSIVVLCNKLRTRILLRKIRKTDVDVLFAPTCSDLIPYLDIKQPIIYLSDATSHLINDYYPGFMALSTEIKQLLNMNEKRTLEKATHVIFSSEWALKDAMEYYKIPKSKISVIRFGANLSGKYVVKDFNKKEFKLLLVGVDWERKGVDTAIDCIKELNRNTEVKFNLTIIGLDNIKNVCDANIKFLGFLDKNNEEDLDVIMNEYQTSDIFILPTIAECSAIVYCEANMFGLPIITFDTGGIPSYVIDNYNGIRLPLGSSGVDFAKHIQQWIQEKKLSTLSNNARKLYEDYLNWDTWAREFSKVVDICDKSN